MRFRHGLIALALGCGSIGLVACVGSDSTVVAGTGDGADGGGANGSGNGNGNSAGNDGGAGASDGAGCGFAGEACCAAPAAACGDGLKCDGASATCLVSDLWAVGAYVDGTSHDYAGVSAHYDGAAFTLGPSMGTGSLPRAVWGDSPTTLRSVTDHGKILLLATSAWQVCGTFACSDPNTMNELSAIDGFGPDDFWVGGVNAMYQCTSTACAPKTTGLGASFGEGNFAGTSSTDLWYSQETHAFHYDGAAWTDFPSLQAHAIWARATNDVWAGDSTLQHYDGHGWSAPFLIDGAAAPGKIYAIGGSSTDNVIAVGYDPVATGNPAFSARWDGASWKKIAMPVGAGDVQAVWVASKKEAFAASINGGLFRFDGTVWTTLTPPTFPAGATNPQFWGLFGTAKPRT